MTTGTHATRPFEVTGPLPRGLTALEASAGTGKTYALSALALRYVVEAGVPIASLCIVSFTEAATAELRGRVRGRFVDAADHLGHHHPGRPADDVLRLLAGDGQGIDAGERERRRQRALDAIRDFDAATVTTIHGFCGRVLAGTGAAMPDADVTGADADVDEVVTDLVLARLGGAATAIRADRIAIAVRARLAMPDAVLHRPPPDAAATDADPAGEAADLVDEAYRAVLARREAERRRTFDGLLHDTRRVLRSPEADAVVAALRSRYRVVLVDEFQDTDRVQWDIFRTAFVEPRPGTTPADVVLVGDPKQAIYRFRAAELSAFVDAVDAANDRATLTTNWRSDAPLLAALERVFGGASFGDDSVVFHAVDAAPGREHRGIEGAGPASFELRCLVPASPDDHLDTPTARRAARADAVDVTTRLLAGQVTVPDESRGRRHLRPRDIAVLTRSNADATAMALALGAAGIPAATAASNSVLDSEAALQWTVLLRALERPGAVDTARAAALGWFIGWTPADLDARHDDDLGDLHELLRSWSTALADRGVSYLLSLARARGLHHRLLGARGGERHVTDLDHVAELLQQSTAGRPVGAARLLAVMSELVDGVGDEAIAPEALSRRIDRDDDAVQVLTVHRAKGLEFAVVLCPFLWTQLPNRQGIAHAQIDGRRLLDAAWIAGVDADGTKALRSADKDEREAEALRLVYVALTRARHRCVVWWAPIDRGTSPLGSLLAQAVGLGTGKVAAESLHRLADGEALEVVTVDAGRRPGAPVTVPALDDGDVALAVSTATRQADATWRIWSFSGIKAMADLRAARGPTRAPTSLAAPILEPAVVGGDDEPAPPPDDDTNVDPAGVRATSLATAPGGTSFGTLVHGVLEHTDFAAADLVGELRTRCADALRFRPLPITADALADGLAGAIEAPLGGPLGGLRLRDLDRSRRLDELAFDLPLGRLRADRIGEVLAAHLEPHDPFRPWAARLAVEGFDLDVDGQLTGSIDLVARVELDGRTRYWLADHKTNQLGDAAEYTADELVRAMAHHHYPLQAALYLVALRRFLRWRAPAARPDDLLGAAYLFLRGMDPSRPAHDARGVCWWQPPIAAIDALDRLLAAGEAQGVA